MVDIPAITRRTDHNAFNINHPVGRSNTGPHNQRSGLTFMGYTCAFKQTQALDDQCSVRDPSDHIKHGPEIKSSGIQTNRQQNLNSNLKKPLCVRLPSARVGQWSIILEHTRRRLELRNSADRGRTLLLT